MGNIDQLRLRLTWSSIRSIIRRVTTMIRICIHISSAETGKNYGTTS